MDANLRRKKILEIIEYEKPTSAYFLSEKLNVSRQAIVGDIALLRALGHEIIATTKGYIIAAEYKSSNKYIQKIACKHPPKDTKSELYTIVDTKAEVLNVIIEHSVYGEITGQLNIKSRSDADIFIKKLETSNARLLSELTCGIHYHTLACYDKPHFEQVVRFLDSKGYLLKNI